MDIKIRGNRWTAAGTITNTGSAVTTSILTALQLGGRTPVVEKVNVVYTESLTDNIYDFKNDTNVYGWGIPGEINGLRERNIGASAGNSNMIQNSSPDPGVKIIGTGAHPDVLDLVTTADAGFTSVFLSGRMDKRIDGIAPTAALTGVRGLGFAGNYWIVSSSLDAGLTSRLFLTVPVGYRPVIDELMPVRSTGGNGAAQTRWRIEQNSVSGIFTLFADATSSWHVLRQDGAPGIADTVTGALQITADHAASDNVHFTVMGHWETQ